MESSVFPVFYGEDCFSCSPHIVQFELSQASSIGKELKMVLLITNKSRHRHQRMHVYQPSLTGLFKIEFDKRGYIAPGLSQKLVVCFRPTSFNYIKDVIRVKGESSEIIIPLHGYPTVRYLEVPKFFSFGYVPLLKPVTKILSISTEVPVEFSFKVEMTELDAHFEVYPLEGIVPANGTAFITVKFTPIVLRLCKTKFRVHVGQMFFQSLQCEIDGEAKSGMIEDSERLKTEQRIQKKLESTVDTLLFARTQLLTRQINHDAAHGDAYFDLTSSFDVDTALSIRKDIMLGLTSSSRNKRSINTNDFTLSRLAGTLVNNGNVTASAARHKLK